ncbi:MAG: hypothetical protein JWM73_1923 [Solirubrobacterales bacterium]|nr:hypothetical protein [Solirubrobacterales bacterium]
MSSRLAVPTTAVALLLAAAALAPVPAGAKGRPCDPVDPSACLLPWPSDYYTRHDAASPTKLRLALSPTSTPARVDDGKHVDVTDFNRADGFSPGGFAIVRVPLVTQAVLERSGAATMAHPERWTAKNAPLVLADAKTGKRWPAVIELDAVAAADEDRALLIRPLRNLREGRRYVIALRNLRAGGREQPGIKPFALLRDRIAHLPRALEARRPSMERVFAELKRAGVRRNHALVVAWDFTVASAQGLAGRLLSIRDRAFAELGDRNLADGKPAGAAPKVAVESVEDLPGDPNLSARVRGTVEVPCFLDQPACPPGARFQIGKDGLPVRTPGNVMQAKFVCLIPRGGTRPLQPVLYGHGLLGSREELVHNEPYAQSAGDHGLLPCATDWSGMASDDLGFLATSILTDLSNFPALADRSQQGILNFLFVARAMRHPQGFAAQPAFQEGGVPILDPAGLAFNGNSQGGIIGGALTAVAPDFTRSVLGVPGMNYSTLLDRSIDFSKYASVLYGHYAKDVQRPLLLALMQQLWDRSEGDGYAQHMTTHPYANTPRHDVLLLAAFGDHQVANFATEVEARTIGAPVRTPMIDPGRAGDYPIGFGIHRLATLPHSGTALVWMDPGTQTPPPPLQNLPPSTGTDPHGIGGNSAAVRALVAEYLRPGGALTAAACGGDVCRIP